MIVAAIMTIISWKLKQPLILGYIAAGIIIGPHTPPFNLISNTDVLNLFSEIGIILLLFTVGMEFPIQKLRNIGKKATIITVVEQIGTLIVGYFGGQALGFSFYNSLFIAVALSVSSTVIIMKVLEELKVLREESSYLTLGVLIIEDVVILSIFAILQSTSVSGTISIQEIIIPIGLTVAFIAAVLIIRLKNDTSACRFCSKNQSKRCFSCCCFRSCFWICLYLKHIRNISSGRSIFCRSINCRIKISCSYEYSYNSYKGYVRCHLFRIGRCTIGY